jgi:hypothetical protein
MNEAESTMAVNIGVEMMRTHACKGLMDLIVDQKQKGASPQVIQSLLQLYRDINSKQV